MNIAVIGTGNTGRCLLELMESTNIIGPFNRGFPPTADALEQADAAIVFTPATAVPDLMPVLLDSTCPVFWGTTGYEWTSEIDDVLRQRSRCWVISENFSTGMVLVRDLLRRIDAWLADGADTSLAIEECHHLHKRDSPSGTALAWQRMLRLPAPIQSRREDDVKGFHQLTIRAGSETIQLTHEVNDRAVFAKGALWAARTLRGVHDPGPGLHQFDRLTANLLTEVAA